MPISIASFEATQRIDADGLIRNLRREGTPDRVYHIELFQDREIEDAADRRYGVTAHLKRDDPHFEKRRAIAMQRFLGYDFVGIGMLSLHACGNRRDVIEDMITDTRIDAIHSWEDKIESILDAKRAYGDRMSLLGGIDVDFLCRAGEGAIRRRVRATIESCQPGGGFCLGSGNTVANYIPLDNYLAMLDEGRRFA